MPCRYSHSRLEAAPTQAVVLRPRGDRGAHACDDFRIVRRVENGRTGDEGVGACRGNVTDVVGLDPAIDFQADGLAAGIDLLADGTQFFQR